LPCNSELQVSIWRLTDQRRVWYEWYAEAFLPVMIPVAASSADGFFDAVTPVLTPLVAPSPMIDALDVPAVERFGTPREASAAQGRLVKIGQTALHNPGGRGSWIGL
jgi:protein arginine N-methyltransferase 5